MRRGGSGVWALLAVVFTGAGVFGTAVLSRMRRDPVFARDVTYALVESPPPRVLYARKGKRGLEFSTDGRTLLSHTIQPLAGGDLRWSPRGAEYLLAEPPTRTWRPSTIRGVAPTPWLLYVEQETHATSLRFDALSKSHCAPPLHEIVEGLVPGEVLVADPATGGIAVRDAKELDSGEAAKQRPRIVFGPDRPIEVRPGSQEIIERGIARRRLHEEMIRAYLRGIARADRELDR